VRQGDTLWDIARSYGTTSSKIRQLNGLNRSSRIYPGQILIVDDTAVPEYVLHQVRRGDTLSRIAQEYRTSITLILANNNIPNPDQLQVGDMLKIYLR
jgi:LysM repeat protein